jgi:hypothetical protein
MADIPATNPVIQPAVPEVVFDLWRIPDFHVTWPNTPDTMSCVTMFQSARRGEDGELIDGPVREWYQIPDLWAVAAEDSEVAAAMNALIAVLTKKAKQAGVI